MATELDEKTEVPEETTGLDEDDAEEMLTLVSNEGGEFAVTKKAASLSELVTSILAGDRSAERIELRQVNSPILELIVLYLQHHNGEVPPELQCPVRSTQMKQIVSDEWDAEYMDDKDKKTIFEIILGANYMDIKSLLHLGCAKIATLIKALDQNEINRIIEEEERYRRENATDDAKEEWKRLLQVEVKVELEHASRVPQSRRLDQRNKTLSFRGCWCGKVMFGPSVRF